MYLHLDNKREREREFEVINTGEGEQTIMADSLNLSISPLRSQVKLSLVMTSSRSPCIQHVVCVRTKDRRIKSRSDSRSRTITNFVSF